MNEERLRILKMVADGKVDPEEAEGLLQALDPQPAPPPLPALPPPPPPPPAPPAALVLATGVVGRGPTVPQRGPAQRLHLVLRGEDGDEVDVTCPIALAGAARHMLPESARRVLERFGLQLEPILESLAHGAPAGNLLKARTEDGDELQLDLE